MKKSKILKVNIQFLRFNKGYNGLQFRTKSKRIIRTRRKEISRYRRNNRSQVIEEKHEEPKTEPVYEINFKVYGTERKIKD